MAAAAVTFDGSRVNPADAENAPWSDIGGGKGDATETDFFYQGGACVSEKVGTSEGGLALDLNGTSSVDYSTTPKVWMAKHLATNNAALNAKGSTGGILEMGSGGRRVNYARWYVVGGDTWPILGGWLITPIDPNTTPSATPGTAPTLTAIDYYGWACTFGATSKGQNMGIDAVDHMDIGTGLTLLDGIATTAGNFALFATTDEDAAENNRWGVVQTREGALIVTGVLTIGNSGTGANFVSVGEVVFWPDAEFVGTAGFFGLDISLENASTVIEITNGTFISRGTLAGASDTRAVVDFTGTTATLAAEIATTNWQNLADFICTSKVHIDGGSIETANLTQATAHIENATIVTNPLTSIACITDPTFATTTDLHDIEFVFGSGGHALELSAIGATVTLTNITFTGYGADTTDSAAIDVTAISGTTTINWSGGTEPTYKTAGATVVVQNTVNVSVTAVDAGVGIEGARVHLLAAAGGDLPVNAVVTIARVTTVATVTRVAHKLTAGQLVKIAGAVQPEYNGIKTIVTVPTADTFTFTVAGSPTTPATGTILATGFIINDLTNASGLAQNTGWPFSSSQPVAGFVRKGTATPTYKTADLIGTITSAGLSITAPMISDD